jgi:imidazolonepropionase-like amidohydrolase
LIVLSSYCAGAAAHELRIEHVTIVSPDRSAPLRDASIEVKDDRITAIVEGSLPPDGSSKADIIDGRGLYVIPGLIDSHVHTSDLPGIDNSHEPTREQIAAEIRKQTPRSYLVKAAHAAHMPVLIHANGTDAQEFAVEAGADIRTSSI